jgi:hypothetical protein
VAERGMLRGSGRGPARHLSSSRRTDRAADRRHHRQPDTALDARERRPERLMTEPSARRDRSCIRQSIRLAIFWPCTSRWPMQTIAPRLGGSPKPFRQRPARTSRSPLSIRATREKSQPRPLPNRDRPRSRQTTRRQAWLRAAAKTVGRRAIFRMGHPLPKTRLRLRAMRPNPRRSPSRRLHLHHP